LVGWFYLNSCNHESTSACNVLLSSDGWMEGRKDGWVIVNVKGLMVVVVVVEVEVVGSQLWW
jgi:hypothetical protein